jgi:hypothetical protein
MSRSCKGHGRCGESSSRRLAKVAYTRLDALELGAGWSWTASLQQTIMGSSMRCSDPRKHETASQAIRSQTSRYVGMRLLRFMPLSI